MAEGKGPIRFGVFEADLMSHTLRKRGVRIRLQELPFRLLAMLLARPGEVVTREELKNELWAEEDYGEFDLGLNTAVKKLRQALDDSANAPRFIETIPKVGYRFLGSAEAGVATGPMELNSKDVPVTSPRIWQALFATTALALLILGFVYFTQSPSGVPDRVVRRFSFAPDHLNFSVIAPDGRHIAYIAGPEATGALWLRPLDSEAPRQLAAPVDAANIPCLAWSPDSSSIAFASDGELKRISQAGTAPVAVAKLPVQGGHDDCVGAAWSPDGETIVFGSGYRPYAVSARGGEARVLFETGGPGEPPNFYSPHFLPPTAGPPALIFDAGTPMGQTSLWVASLGSGEQRELAPGSRAWYSDSGHLIHGPIDINQSGLWALPFSLDALTVTGESFRIAQSGGRASLARDGTLVYMETPHAGLERLVWRDRTGSVVETVGQPQTEMVRPAVSPDGLLVAVASKEIGRSDIWIHDLVRGSKTRLTFEDGGVNAPTWSPSGREVAYWAGSMDEGFSIMSKSVDGAADSVVLVGPEQGNAFDSAWLQDGQSLVYAIATEGVFGASDIWYATRTGSGFERKVFLSTLATEGIPTPSPDGLYLAYVSDESGRVEVYVRRFPDGSDRRQVSINGGTQPTWRRDGRELFYVEGASMMAVDVSDERGLTLGRPRRLFDSEDLRSFNRHAEYDVSPDGELFLTTTPDEKEPGGAVIRLVENWYEEFSDQAK